MRSPPDYPKIAQEKQLNWKPWLQGLLTILAAALLITNLFWPEGKSTKTALFWFISVIFPAMIWALIFCIYLFFNKLTLYSRTLYLQAIEEDEAQWWKYQSIALPIENVIIIGCLGGKQFDNAMLIRNKPVAPDVINEDGQQIIRCPLLIGNKDNRDEMLVRYLIEAYCHSYPFQQDDSVLSHIYWLGSAASLKLFIKGLTENNIPVPIRRFFIQSIDTLDDIIDTYYQECHQHQYMLIAGTNIHEQTDNEPLAETGFMWRVSAKGKLGVHRCEATSLPTETLPDLTAQLLKYTRLSAPPSMTIAMDQESAFAFIDANWYGLENNLAPYYGGRSLSSPYMAISQATMHCIQNNIDSCGWISQFSHEQYIAGVISQYEQP